MANIFAILTALVLALAAFVAFKNQGKTEEPGTGYKGWIAKREQATRGGPLRRDQQARSQGDATQQQLCHLRYH